MVDELAPGQRPLCMQPGIDDGYPGVVEPPTFDGELPDLDAAGSPPPAIMTRYREIARLHAYGHRNKEIAQALGYTPNHISTVLRNSFVQEEIQRERAKFADADAVEIMRNASVDGARRLHAFIKDPDASEKTVLAASQFAIEKTHGKAIQQHQHESGTLMQYMDLLQQSIARGEDPGQPIDVTPQQPALPGGDTAPADPWGTWLDQND